MSRAVSLSSYGCVRGTHGKSFFSDHFLHQVRLLNDSLVSLLAFGLLEILHASHLVLISTLLPTSLQVSTTSWILVGMVVDVARCLLLLWLWMLRCVEEEEEQGPVSLPAVASVVIFSWRWWSASLCVSSANQLLVIVSEVQAPKWWF